MKALLLKDLYMMKTYSRTFLLVACAFLAMTLFGEGARLAKERYEALKSRE